MKNLTFIHKKGVFASIANLKMILSAGAYIIRGDYALDATHTLNPEENALLIISTRKGPDPNLPQKDKIRHSLVICSQGAFFDDVMVWSFEYGAVHKYALSPVPLTTTTSTNKTQLDLFLFKVPNAQVMHCTYKDVYAGTLHKINGSWYGVLVSESNTLAGQLSIKLQADGTIVEGTA